MNTETNEPALEIAEIMHEEFKKCLESGEIKATFQNTFTLHACFLSAAFKILQILEHLKNTNQLNKEALVDYIYEFAWHWGRFHHFKDRQKIIDAIKERLQLPEEVLDTQNIIEGHPEYRCQICGSRNPDWRCSNELFNKVNGSPNGILCPACFLDKAKEKKVWVEVRVTELGTDTPSVQEQGNNLERKPGNIVKELLMEIDYMLEDEGYEPGCNIRTKIGGLLKTDKIIKDLTYTRDFFEARVKEKDEIIDDLKQKVSKLTNFSDTVGNCGRHPGFNMVNCPICATESAENINSNKEKIHAYKLKEHKKTVDNFMKLFEPQKKYYAVQYANYWNIQDSEGYEGKNILDAELVGEEQAKANAELIAYLLNKQGYEKEIIG